MNCPTCEKKLCHDKHEEVLFEICSGCGLIWVDFSHRRERAHAPVQPATEELQRLFSLPSNQVNQVS